MITRIWHGRTSLEDADDHLEFLLLGGTKEYLQSKGSLSVKVRVCKEEFSCHFLAVSEWLDIEAIRGFAGEDYEKAKYYPQDNDFLLECEDKVIHCETYPVLAQR